jgi:hypothetical protein
MRFGIRILNLKCNIKVLLLVYNLTFVRNNNDKKNLPFIKITLITHSFILNILTTIPITLTQYLKYYVRIQLENIIFIITYSLNTLFFY